MKPRFLLLLAILLQTPVLLKSQESQKVQLLLGDGYVTKSSIVRQYDAKFQVIMTYGHYVNSVAPSLPYERSSFYWRDANNGHTVHIVTLPNGYKVNDVKFVSLTQFNNIEDVYCCFCGTFYNYVDIYGIVEPENPRTQHFYYYDTIGFVGYFKMEEALAPNSTYTAKIRKVEKAKELYRMICYPNSWVPMRVCRPPILTMQSLTLSEFRMTQSMRRLHYGV